MGRPGFVEGTRELFSRNIHTSLCTRSLMSAALSIVHGEDREGWER
jgi:hypothetical protein